MRRSLGAHLAVAALLGSALSGLAGAAGARAQEVGGEPAGSGAAVGLPAPLPLGPEAWRWTLRTLDGEEVPLERFRGRTVFVNFWATWCPPCVAELASIRRLAESLAGTGVGFLLVTPEEEAPVRRFLRRNDPGPWVVFEHTRAPDVLTPAALPTTFVVDRAGRVVLRHRGAADWDQDAVRAFLRRLDREPGTP